MNGQGEETNIEQNQQKTKLNQLSKYIFDIICQKKEISDTDLMQELVQQFGSVKEETLKRRKYDTVNILINCDIILSKRITGGFLYKMKHDVPNSVRDLQMIKKLVSELQNKVTEKKQILHKIKVAEQNYQRLIKLNEIRPKDQQTSIMLPFVVTDRKFIEYQIKCKNHKETAEMKFPEGTTYISNLLAEKEFFIF